MNYKLYALAGIRISVLLLFWTRYRLKKFLNKEQGLWQDNRQLILILILILKHMYKTHSWDNSWVALRQTYLRPLNRLETRTVAKIHPSPPLLFCLLISSSVNLMQTTLFVLFCSCYVARSMSSKDTCFVVTCKNKAICRVISLLCISFSIGDMARSLSRGWESTQIV